MQPHPQVVFRLVLSRNYKYTVAKKLFKKHAITIKHQIIRVQRKRTFSQALALMYIII